MTTLTSAVDLECRLDSRYTLEQMDCLKMSRKKKMEKGRRRRNNIFLIVRQFHNYSINRTDYSSTNIVEYHGTYFESILNPSITSYSSLQYVKVHQLICLALNSCFHDFGHTGPPPVSGIDRLKYMLNDELLYITKKSGGIRSDFFFLSKK